jgi:hypothetical protein
MIVPSDNVDGGARIATINTHANTGPLTARDCLSVVGNGSGRVTTGIVTPVLSAGTSSFAVDGANGSTLTLTNGTTGQPFGANANFSGLMLVNDPSAIGSTAVFLIGGNAINLIGESKTGTTYYSTTQGTPSKTNIYLDGSNIITVENRLGVTVTYRVMAFRLRSSS